MKTVKDDAYWERNQLILYLSKIFTAWKERHSDADEKWDDQWRNIVFIEFPEGKYSWHILDCELKYFDHLSFKEGDSWDGSTSEEKYNSLRGR